MSSIPVRNPRTGEIDYWITPPKLSEECDRLRMAQPVWAESLEQRISALQQWQQAIQTHREALLTALVADTGRFGVSVLEIDSVLSSLDRWCKLAPELLQEIEKPTAIPFIHLKQDSVPYPLVGVISPWNFPFLLAMIDTIPALLAGCAVIVKPSEIAPRFIQPLLKTLDEVPKLREIFTVIEGAGETGAALIEQVDLVCFTGSVKTGRIVAEAAAKQFIPAFLELGGKDPAIVLKSADLDLATSAILWGSVVNTGQSCLSIERIYVDQSIAEPFTEQLVSKAKQLKLAYPTVNSGEIGPMIAERQAAIISDQLQDAIDKGAIVQCGGKVENLAGGWWCYPTVLTNVDHSMKIMTEETFGAIMPIMPFTTVEEAVQLANDTIYGLSAAVFAGSETEALSVGDRIQAGAISINDAALTALIHEGEKNAFNYSGMGGSRMGSAALKRFMRKKAYLIKTKPVTDPWWFQ
ncbi:aldehyde dehydrogenase [Leptolyngbya boryana NIES-2135]|jgi:succinate-semialdehyde dehydrogenase/glutarate-semialdehyde dehydrogenase|uniref:Aldehyde dehydrogenase n=1 Tax=Leptolyngbya boryana NIES-2135 TaxID=1973484 RepID=A0A1Z4JGA1_LEPBY|nr:MULTISPECIES: aldehyde dehydrogenase family protein [Leptolyngbya]BAY55779.1 aldehyde dehydrogenase [Leptolyngbya boryana NIES-2135]MBD2370328.1 aldehyde dehydrogenase family protein [Leptolyngbya sp. FACHB-161]MBD2376672.1 aldehyde dehydrogenase family protein [Leptolyngbya sp. FACHB-238]MBD2400942.1 aldehyde dehydrogenase family protein [Leptolyngbya sp. FACHB-239]MBD2407590.1 aldehyde dehydrogenase family protein [Leptolyngbya sp. FACHB-402]